METNAFAENLQSLNQLSNSFIQTCDTKVEECFKRLKERITLWCSMYVQLWWSQLPSDDDYVHGWSCLLSHWKRIWKKVQADVGKSKVYCLA